MGLEGAERPEAGTLGESMEKVTLNIPRSAYNWLYLASGSGVSLT